jgi:nitroimidazol reductase NimA-like FMN-containing flavoprotein (pyridoxamine 5'-phosphate oxidase superfamily)
MVHGAAEMTHDEVMRGRLRALFDSQRYAVLATESCGQPLTSLMAFAVTDDLRHLVMMSDRKTRKFANLAANRRVALLVDDRGNKATDTRESIAVTVLGLAFEADADTRDALAGLFLARHPGLAAFAAAPDCVVVRVEVSAYLLVQQFEHTLEWRPDPQMVSPPTVSDGSSACAPPT